MAMDRTPMQQAICYFAARGELEKTSKLLRDIRRRNRGSVRQTALFLTQAEACRHMLHQWVALLQRTPSTRLQ
jgi:hypothetical protein